MESLRQYYNKKVLSTGTAEDFVQYTERMAGELSAATKEATKAVEAEVTRLNQHIEPQIFGTSIHKKLANGKSILKGKAKDLYDKIPDLKLETGKLSDDIKIFCKSRR